MASQRSAPTCRGNVHLCWHAHECVFALDVLCRVRELVVAFGKEPKAILI